jgi:hypothetical protein
MLDGPLGGELRKSLLAIFWWSGFRLHWFCRVWKFLQGTGELSFHRVTVN